VTFLEGVVLPATGVGSLPGDDPLEACRLVFGEFPDLPHLPELPERGPGADMIGRTASVLTDLWVDLQPSGWRFVPREGVDSRRASDLLARDLDALEEIADGWQGPLKIQAAGPWTLAAGIELPRGDRALADPGAVRDVAESLADGLARHAAEIRRRIPGLTTLLVQLDEPSLPAVLAGQLPTASGFDVLPAVEGQRGLEGLRMVMSAIGGDAVRVGVHCCASDVPIRLLTEAGAAFLGIDIGLLRAPDDDPLGEAIDAGLGILLGAVPATRRMSDVGHTVEAVRSLWHRVGFGAERMREVAAVTPTCGLAGADYVGARSVMRVCREAAKALSEEGS
jgi:methionine synthase II (cobalamin-independent)